MSLAKFGAHFDDDGNDVIKETTDETDCSVKECGDKGAEIGKTLAPLLTAFIATYKVNQTVRKLGGGTPQQIIASVGVNSAIEANKEAVETVGENVGRVVGEVAAQLWNAFTAPQNQNQNQFKRQ